MIRVKGLCKQFGEMTAVDDASFEVPPRSICGFVGPNGAGKTTTLRILATLETPSAGTAYINHACIESDLQEVRQRTGFMPDYCGTFPHMSSAEFLDFFARAHRLGAKTRQRRLAELIEFLELEPLLPRPVDRLSKGQKQRLSLARALLSQPDVLILDEPAAGLDPRARMELFELLKILAAQGTTIFLSSHILSELAAYATWLVVINAGRIRYQGSPDEAVGEKTEGTAFTLEITSEMRQAKWFLLAQPSVLNVSQTDDCFVELCVDEETESVEDLLGKMIVAGIRLRQVIRRQPRLEDLFMRVTEEGEMQ